MRQLAADARQSDTHLGGDCASRCAGRSRSSALRLGEIDGLTFRGSRSGQLVDRAAGPWSGGLGLAGAAIDRRARSDSASGVVSRYRSIDPESSCRCGAPARLLLSATSTKEAFGRTRHGVHLQAPRLHAPELRHGPAELRRRRRRCGVELVEEEDVSRYSCSTVHSVAARAGAAERRGDRAPEARVARRADRCDATPSTLAGIQRSNRNTRSFKASVP